MKNKSERIELRLETSLLEDIDAARITDNGQISRSEWIRQALKYVLRLKHYQIEANKLRDKGVSKEIMREIDSAVDYLTAEKRGDFENASIRLVLTKNARQDKRDEYV